MSPWFNNKRPPIPVFTKTLSIAASTSTSYTVPKGHYAIAHLRVGGSANAQLNSVLVMDNGTTTFASLVTSILPEQTVIGLQTSASASASAVIMVYKI